MQSFLYYTSIPVFYRKNKYSKVVNEDIRGTSTGPSCRTSQGPNDGTFRGHPQDVGHISFLNSSHKHMKLVFTGYSRLAVAKNSVNSIVVKK